AISITDSYVYPHAVWGVFVEQVSGPARGRATDQAKLAAALPKSATCLAALADIMGAAPYLAGAELTLADLHLAPMLDYFRQAPDGARLLAGQPRIGDWWTRMAARPSIQATTPPPRS